MESRHDEQIGSGSTGSFYMSLHPSQSLSRVGFIILMSAVTAVSFVAGAFFWAIGAWPVFGFFGLDVLLIYGAFQLNFRAARRREIVEINHDMVLITRIASNGQSVREEIQAYWSRINLQKGKLWLTNRGRSYEIGYFLGEEEKEQVREILAEALDTYRKGGHLQSPSPSTSIMS